MCVWFQETVKMVDQPLLANEHRVVVEYRSNTAFEDLPPGAILTSLLLFFVVVVVACWLLVTCAGYCMEEVVTKG